MTKQRSLDGRGEREHLSEANVRGRIIKGISANAVGQLVNIATQLASVPAFLAALGVDRYGEWLVLSSVAAFLSMSDIGFGSAAANEMTMEVGRGDRHKAIVVYQSMWVLLSILGGAMLGVVLGVVWFTPAISWLPLKLTSTTAAATVLSAMAANVLIGQQGAVAQSGFRCDGNYALGQFLGSGVRLIEMLAQLAVAFAVGSLVSIAVATLLVRCCGTVLFLGVLRHKSPWLQWGVNLIDFGMIRRLAAPAMAFFGMPLGYAISNQGMLQVVAVALGPGMVVVYSTHRTLANFGIQFMSLINQAVWPEMSLAFGAHDLPMARKLNRRICQLTFWLAMASSVAVAFLAVPLFWIWTNGAIAANYPLLLSLLGVVVLRSMWLASSVVPSAINRHVRLAVAFVVATVMSLCLGVLLIPRLGVVGAGLSLLAADAVMAVLTVHLSIGLVKDDLSSFVRHVIAPPSLRELVGGWLKSIAKRQAL